MEETFLYHKLEAMRLVNEQIGDPAQSTSDGCLSLIAALALVEVCDVLKVSFWDRVLIWWRGRAVWGITSLPKHISTACSTCWT